MSISSERYFLGGLVNEIDKDINPDLLDNTFSKDDTTYKTSKEQNISSSNSVFSQTSPSFFPPSLQMSSSFLNQSIPIKSDKANIFTKQNLIIIFSNQKLTKELQKKLPDASNEFIDNIINQLLGTYRLVIKNKNGNYFCSDLIKKCNKEQRIKILKELSMTISQDCIDEYASHVIQKLIEYASGEEEYNLILFSFNNFNNIILSSMNKNGSFVIQKIIVIIPEKFRMKFNLIFVNFILLLSKDVYGIGAVKKFIAYTQKESIRKQFLNTIFNNIVNISSNQYGNYLIQYLLEKLWKTSEGVYLKKLIFSKFLILASNYYSSFICDLFYKLCNDEEKKSLSTFINSNNKTLDCIYKNNDFKNNRIPSCLNKIVSNNTLKMEKDENQNIKKEEE